MTGGGKRGGRERNQAKKYRHHQAGTGAPPARFRIIMSALAAIACTAACKAPPTQAEQFAAADAIRGRELIVAVGCGACHTIKGIDWPQGRSAPGLRGLAGRALIAGQLPNTPENLAAFVREAPRVAPGTTMPAMPLDEQQSRDVAAYLYQIED
jgi:mono/diheme cytochrome c family protein